jgi:hypothetical protein
MNINPVTVRAKYIDIVPLRIAIDGWLCHKADDIPETTGATTA